MPTLDLVNELQRYGAAKSGVRIFDTPTPDDIRYLDLFKQPQIPTAQSSEVLPSGVVEYSDRPLIYLLRDDALSVAPQVRTDQVQRLIRSLACRGEGSFLAVVQPGELQIFPILLSKSIASSGAIRATESHAPVLIQDLATGSVDWLRNEKTDKPSRDQRVHESAIHGLLFKLLTEVTEALRNSRALSHKPEKDDVLPLVGRALFTRFLIDRGIINAQTFPEIYSEGKPADCFSAPEFAALTCRWLDDKFNGDVLPLADGDYPQFFQNVHRRDKNVLHQLSNVMYRAPGGVLTFDLFWNGIDFAHVPVGLLSEVYEDYAHRFFKDDARLESVRFTPRHIAEFTVNQAFQGLQKNTKHQARLLDPAAGAGVFLVIGLQRLVAENWRAAGERPDTKKIRDILDNQIRGFDINTSALTLAALSLYLTALEIDPAPYPPEKLRFSKLLGNVLFNMRAEHEAYPYGKPVLGSLGSEGARVEHLGKFDVIVGNPPWTAWSGETGHMLTEHVNTMVREIVKARARNEVLTRIAESYEHNDMIPDIAFVWRTAQWAKEDGVIALIVHARILFKRGEKGASMREALLRSFRITGILNGAELMKLWPHLNQPFCILFARNRISQPGDTFRYVTPELERAPDGGFQMRIDSESAQPIQFEVLERQPFLLKSLFRGGRLDVELMKRLNALTVSQAVDVDHDEEERSDISIAQVIPPRAVRIRDLWSKAGGLFGGQGYMPGTGQKATELLALEGKRLTKHDSIGLFVSAARLDSFTDRQVHRRRDPRIYRPPLVLISEGFSESAERIRVRLYLGRTPLIYNRSFYGYSTAGRPRPEELARFLFVIASSDLFAYYILQSSAKFGVERRTVLEEDIGDFPVIALESLDDSRLRHMQQIVDQLSPEMPRSWRALNDWVNELYNLTANDRQVIEDTLDTRMPFDAATKNALRPATVGEKQDFVESVKTILSPFFKSTNDTIHGTLFDSLVDTWVIFDLQTDDREATGSPDAITEVALLIADHEGSSRVMQEVSSGHLRLAIRNQYRYLTKTRARLCAIDILREKGHLFPVGEK